MRAKHRTYSPAVDRDGICAAQTTAEATNLTIGGALASGGVATLAIPGHISIYSGGDISGVTFTVTGTDRMGDALSESITGPNTTTVKGSYNFATVTQVACDGAVGTNVEVGTADEFETGWYPVEYRAEKVINRVYLYDTPSLTWELKYTYEDPFDADFDEYTCDSESAAAASSVSSTIELAGGVRAVRLYVTSFSTGDIDWSVIVR